VTSVLVVTAVVAVPAPMGRVACASATGGHMIAARAGMVVIDVRSGGVRR
jgi:hypothetical protein